MTICIESYLYAGNVPMIKELLDRTAGKVPGDAGSKGIQVRQEIRGKSKRREIKEWKGKEDHWAGNRGGHSQSKR